MMRTQLKPLGIVLAGGKSSRMGNDKAWLPFFGQPLLRHVASTLANVTGEILVSGRDPSAFGLDAPWLPDDEPGLGPAGAVLTVLRATGRPCLVVSCDLPFLDEATLFRLLTIRRSRERHMLMTTFRIMEKGYIESLVAVYEPEGVPLLCCALARGERRLSTIFPESIRLHIDYSQKDSAVALPFLNVNSKKELTQAKAIEALLESNNAMTASSYGLCSA